MANTPRRVLLRGGRTFGRQPSLRWNQNSTHRWLKLSEILDRVLEASARKKLDRAPNVARRSGLSGRLAPLSKRRVHDSDGLEPELHLATRRPAEPSGSRSTVGGR